MSTLFISYSNKDRSIALEVYDQLVRHGYHLPFLDYHPDSGIPGGSKWEDELRWQLKVARGLVVLCSKSWQQSQWCFAELDRAKELKKPVIPLNLDDMTLPNSVSIYQSIPFHQRSDEVYQRLWRALETHGLHPSDDFCWPRDECPYPGLASFQEEHAGVYFGRDDELSAFLDRYLAPMRQIGECRMIYVIGPSGSGKSSFVRAGILPRLRFKSHGEWKILTVFRWAELKRFGQRWDERLAQEMQRLYHGHPLTPGWDAQDRARRYASDDSPESCEKVARRFVLDVKDLLAALELTTATPLIVIDQFEELLAADADGARQRLLRFLGCCLAADDSPCRAVATVRSDYLPAIQQHPELVPWNEQTRMFRLDVLKQDRLFDVVRRPAEAVDVRFENDALVNRIVGEAHTSDALPLLAFALRRFFETSAADRVLTSKEYDSFGGLHQCLNNVAQEVLAGPMSPNGRVDPAAEDALRICFVRDLVGWEEGEDEKGGRFVRKIARWADLPPESQPLIRRMCSEEFRLLSMDQREGSETTVEVTHEALFRQWDTLRGWLNQRLDLLRWRADLKRSRIAAGDRWSGLTRTQLAIAVEWPRTRPGELTSDEIGWIESAKRRLRLFRAAIAITAAVAFAVLATAWYLYVDRDRKKQEADLAEQRSNVAKLQRDLAFQQRSAAEKSEAEAQALAKRRTIRALIATGDSLGGVGRWGESRSYYARAAALLQENGTSPLPALAGLADVFVHAPLPLAVLTGHHEAVTAVAFLPDGQRAISAAGDSVIVWDLALGSEQRRLVGHQGKVFCIAVSPDGQFAVTGGEDRSVKQWNLDTGELLHDFQEHRAGVRSVAVSNDTQRLAAGSESVRTSEYEVAPGVVRVWDLANKSQISEFVAHEGAVRSLAFAAGVEGQLRSDVNAGDRQASYLLISGGEMNRTMFMGDDEGELMLWNGDTGAAIRSFGGHRYQGRAFIGHVYGVAASQPRSARPGSMSGKALLLSGSLDHTVRLWDLRSGVHLRTFVGHNSAVNSVCFSRDTRRALSGSDDGSAVLWDAEDGKVIRRLEGHKGSVASVAISQDGELALTGGNDGRVLLWNATMRLDKRLQEFWYSFSEGFEQQSPPGAVHTVSITPDGRLGLCGCTAFTAGKRPVDRGYNELLKVFDVRSGAELYSLRGDPLSVFSSAWTADGTVCAFAGAEKQITLLSIKAGETVGRCVGHRSDVTCLAIPRTGGCFMSGSSDCTVRWWNIPDGRLISTCSGHTDAVTAVAVADNGELGMSGSKDGTVRLWRSVDGSLVETLNHGDAVYCVALSPDSKLGVSGGADRVLRVWDVPTGKVVATLRGHLDAVCAVNWVRKANMLASAGLDGSVRLWDVESWDELRRIDWGSSKPILSLALSDDGGQILVGSIDQQVRVLDVSRVLEYQGFESSVRDAERSLVHHPAEPDATAIVGRWFGFNGLARWALRRLEASTGALGQVSPSCLGTLYLREGRLEDALCQFRGLNDGGGAVTDRDVGLLSLRRLAERLVRESVAASGRKEWPLARAKADAAIELDPRSSSAFLRRGFARYYLGDKLGAADDYKTVVRLESEPQYASILSQRFSATAHYNLACLAALEAAQAGEDRNRLVDRAIGELTIAIDSGFDEWSTLSSDSDLDTIRSDKRFQELLKRGTRR